MLRPVDRRASHWLDKEDFGARRRSPRNHAPARIRPQLEISGSIAETSRSMREVASPARTNRPRASMMARLWHEHADAPHAVALLRARRFRAASLMRSSSCNIVKLPVGMIRVKPGDLPVQLPTRYEFMIKLSAAKALGLDVASGSTFSSRWCPRLRHYSAAVRHRRSLTRSRQQTGLGPRSHPRTIWNQRP
jgi:hypothetical protein